MLEGALNQVQDAFKDLMIHDNLRFTLHFAACCVLHRGGSQDIHCWKSYDFFFGYLKAKGNRVKTVTLSGLMIITVFVYFLLGWDEVEPLFYMVSMLV